MSLYRRWRNWSNASTKFRRLLMEAAWELLRARLIVRFGLGKALPALLEASSNDDPGPPAEIEAGIRRSIRIAAAEVPWTSLCLPNAIAAKRMLRRRGYTSTLHLGVGNRSSGNLHAHAWLEAGGKIITGEEGMGGLAQLPRVPSKHRNEKLAN